MSKDLSTSPERDEAADAEQEAFLAGQLRFAEEVSRVWSSQIESSRTQMDTAVADLTIRFSGIVARLNAMVDDQAHAANGSADARAAALFDSSEKRLNSVVDALRTAMQSKAQMIGKVQSLQGFLNDLSKMAFAISRVAQQTHLLSINAAIEAAHAGASGSGFAVVAQEVRSLSKMSADTGADITKTVETLQNAIRSTKQAADESARQDEQAMQSAEETIRLVIDEFSGLTGSLRESAEVLREESRGIKAEIDEAIFHLQFQDRIGQVMAHVCQNIEQWPELQRRNAEACQREGRLIPLDAEWLLSELAATYAMVDEHRIHEGAAPVSAPSVNEITFF